MGELVGLLNYWEADKPAEVRMCSYNSKTLTVFKSNSYEEVDFDIHLSTNTKIDTLPARKYTIVLLSNDTTYHFQSESKKTFNTWLSVLTSCTIIPTPISINDFTIIEEIGNGQYGKVKLAKKKDTGDFFAIKVIHKQKLVEMEKMNMIMCERNILSKASCPFIVQLHYAFQNETKFYLCMEYIPGGTLFDHMKLAGTIPPDELKLYTAEIAIALHHLHVNNIVYRDLKPENVLLDEDGHIKLTDFGTAKQTDENGTLHTFCGTPEYIAPEIIQGKPYNFKVDWWSLGILIYEMVFKAPPFYSVNPKRTLDKIVSGNLIFPGVVDENLVSLIKGLLNKDPKQRFGYNEVMSHPLLSKFDVNNLLHKSYSPNFLPSSVSMENIVLTDNSLPDSLGSLVSNEFKFINGFSFTHNEFACDSD